MAKSSLVIDAAAIAALADVRLGGVADDGIAADDLVEARAWKWLEEGEPERAFGEIAAAFDSGAVPADPFSLGRLELLRAFALRASGNFDGARLLATKELGRDRIRGAFWRSLAAELASS